MPDRQRAPLEHVVEGTEAAKLRKRQQRVQHFLPVVPSFIADESWTAWAEEEPGRLHDGGPDVIWRFKPFEHQWAVAEAFQFHQEISKTRVAERTHALNRQLKEGLSEMPHVTLYTPRSEALSAGIVSFDVEGRSPEGVVNHLQEHGIVATTTPYATTHARLTPSIYNTPDEIETTLRTLRPLA